MAETVGFINVVFSCSDEDILEELREKREFHDFVEIE